MAKELIYLGRDGDCVRLALVDLEDLSVRTVPVKKVLRTELNKLRAEGLQRADGFGVASSDTIRNTIRALREGRPDGYILNDNKCSQVLFDLACKQPKNI